MIVGSRSAQKGWISLPIIGLLALFLGLASHYQSQLLDGFKWNATLNESQQRRQKWLRFAQEKVLPKPNFSQASTTSCHGFCPLTQAITPLNNRRWQDKDGQFFYQFERYESPEKETFHRLCATQNRHQYYCWWWRNRQLKSQGLVTALH